MIFFPIKISFLELFYQQNQVSRNKCVAGKTQMKFVQKPAEPIKIILASRAKMIGSKMGGPEHATGVF
jgi:hypothetical protein